MPPKIRLPNQKPPKQVVDAGSSSSRSMVENPLPWLHKAPLPANWDSYKTRDIVAERKFDCSDILKHSAHAKVQLSSVDEFFRAKHVLEYCQAEGEAYPSLTKLFYAGLQVDDEYTSIQGSIGKFGFSLEYTDILALLDPDDEYTDSVTRITSATIQDAYPDIEQLVQMFFIAPGKNPYTLINHADILLFMIINTNVLPSKGNKSELTEKMVQVMWVIHNYKPCLAHYILHGIIGALKGRKNASLPFPRLITRILVAKGYKMPQNHEMSIPLEIVNASKWDHSLKKASKTREEAFRFRGWNDTIGMVVGGTEVLDQQAKKRRFLELSVAPASSRTPIDSDMSARLDNALATMTNMISNLSLTMTQRFIDLETKVDVTRTTMNGGFLSVNSKLDQFYSEVLSWYDQQDYAEDDAPEAVDVAEHDGSKDGSDGDSQPLHGDDPVA